MLIQIQLELTDAMHLLEVFGGSDSGKTAVVQSRAKAVVEKIADQVDVIIRGLEEGADLREG